MISVEGSGSFSMLTLTLKISVSLCHVTTSSFFKPSINQRMNLQFPEISILTILEINKSTRVDTPRELETQPEYKLNESRNFREVETPRAICRIGNSKKVRNCDE